MTALDWYYEQTVIKGKTNYYELLEKAKEMEKQQIIDAHLIGLITSLETEATKQATDYYSETYGSKGSDETKVVEFDHLKKEVTSSQTEISDEEIEKEIKKRYETTQNDAGFRDGCAWYREQLKSKQ